LTLEFECANNFATVAALNFKFVIKVKIKERSNLTDNKDIGNTGDNGCAGVHGN
jgi:hypothetical protein